MNTYGEVKVPLFYLANEGQFTGMLNECVKLENLPNHLVYLCDAQVQNCKRMQSLLVLITLCNAFSEAQI